VNVKGSGPANLLASFQSVKGEFSGKEISSSVLSIITLNFDLVDEISFEFIFSF
jgi:hypothetical protein